MHSCLCDYVVGIHVPKSLLPVLQVLWQSHSHISMALYPSYKLCKEEAYAILSMSHVSIVILLLVHI